MYYAALLIIIFITIITIVTSILFTIAIDNLARLSTPSNSINSSILDNVISIGSYIVIFLIFLIAVELTIAILVYYNSKRNTTNNFAYYASIILAIATIGLLFLEIYLYNEIKLFNTDSINSIISDSIDLIFWGIILTLLTLILSFILIFLV